MTARKLYIKTYGCQMNVYDTQRMQDVLAPLGYAPSESPEGADLVILNTCHIREKAEDKVFSDLGRIRKEKDRLKGEGKDMLVAVGGCVGQAQGEEIIRRAPYVSMVFGPQSYHHLPEMVTKAVRGQGGIVELEFPAVPKFDFLPESKSEGASAFLAVQEGCDKFCTFCVVPYTRGAEYSRGVAQVEAEARSMAERGVVEITLLGQNVNAYHGAGPDGGEWNLAKLIRRLAKIEGIQRIRYTTSHPRDMDDDLIAAHGEVEKLMPYLHLPVQSGSDKVLKAMNRRHTAAFYLDIIERLRKARPDIALSSDFIVGFPGESEQDFKDTMALVETVGFASAFSFKYSPRPGTPAATDEAQVEEPVKEMRLALLQGLLNRQQEAFNRASVGQVMPVLFEKPGKHAGQAIGKSPWLQSVHVQGAQGLMGQIVPVRITGGFANSLSGELLQDMPCAA
jgi:tRNA-2-methylthio-N6-dimethylallyladenosine synthase